MLKKQFVSMFLRFVTKLAFLFVVLALFIGPVSAQPEKYAMEVGQDASALVFMLLKGPGPEGTSPSKSTRLDLAALVKAYHRYIKQIEFSGSNASLRLTGGAVIPWDDGLAKTFQDKLESPDLEDALRQVYPVGPFRERTPKDFDPGRCRVEALLKTVYGSNEEQVRKNLVPIRFCGKRILFNSQNRAAHALARVGKELTILLHEKPGLHRYLLPITGTFNWRVIKGTDRLSPHSFGIAIDLNAREGAYWRWNRQKADPFELTKRYPYEIVSIFEKHGFIWGGKWYHYDLMHFEYRPELLHKEKLIRTPPSE